MMNHNEPRTGRPRSVLWGVVGGMAFCATMMAILMVAGPKLMGRMCGKMRGMMGMCGAEDPIDPLKRRYAAGEVSEEEFLRMKQELEK